MRLGLFLALIGLCGLATAQFYGDYKDGAVPGQGRVAMNAAGVGVHVDQKLNEFVPMDAMFNDETGKKVEVKDLLTGRPIVVLPIFYKCPGVCQVELTNLTQSLKGFKKDFIGQTFDVLVLSIDPRETPLIANARKDSVIAEYMGATVDREKRLHAEHGMQRDAVDAGRRLHGEPRDTGWEGSLARTKRPQCLDAA